MQKKLLLFTCALLTYSATLFAQDAPEVQNSLISKIAATWCPPCGGWGWNFFHDLEEDNHEKALVIAVHHSGDLVNATASALTDNFGASSQPRFYLNNADQSASSGNVAAKRVAIQEAVNANNAMAPVVNTGLQAILDTLTGIITVNTKTRFFQETQGEYALGLYLIEDQVENFQASIGEGAIHTNILRGDFSNNPFGVELANGPIAVGTEVVNTFTMNVNPEWNLENVSIAAIIWKSENNGFTFVNTNSTSTLEEPSPVSINNITSATWKLNIQPTISSGDAAITVALKESAEQFDLVVLNQIGMVSETLHSGSLTSGAHTFTLTKKLPKGIYLVRSNSGNMVETKRMIIVE
jgi:Outer membrane protein Omp28